MRQGISTLLIAGAAIIGALYYAPAPDIVAMPDKEAL
jgi:hypothetical protein